MSSSRSWSAAASRSRLWLIVGMLTITLGAFVMHQLAIDYTTAGDGSGPAVTIVPVGVSEPVDQQPAPAMIEGSTAVQFADSTCGDDCQDAAVTVACLLALTLAAGVWRLRHPRLYRLREQPRLAPNPLAPSVFWRPILTPTELSISRT